MTACIPQNEYKQSHVNSEYVLTDSSRVAMLREIGSKCVVREHDVTVARLNINIMFTHNALTPDFSQHGNTRAVSQDMGNKVTGATYLKK